jgi:hypothetical protein
MELRLPKEFRRLALLQDRQAPVSELVQEVVREVVWEVVQEVVQDLVQDLPLDLVQELVAQAQEPAPDLETMVEMELVALLEVNQALDLALDQD